MSDLFEAMAMTSFALCFLQAASAPSSSGRSLRLPLSIAPEVLAAA
jgi:hypothetical protein